MKEKPNPNRNIVRKTPGSGLREDNLRAGEAPKGGKPGQGQGGQPQAKGTGPSGHR